MEDAAGEPVVHDRHEQPGDKEPDRDHDSRPRRIVGERRRLHADQRQSEPGEEGDGDDRVLTVVSGLARIVAERREDRPRSLRHEERAQPPSAGLVFAHVLRLRVHRRSVRDAATVRIQPL